MNHKKVYRSIIVNAKNRKTPGYTERHHIKPKCLGGTNHENNLVYLTAKEHFIVHALLCHMHPKNKKIIYAFHCMRHWHTNKQNRYVPSYEYAYLKEEYNKVNRGRVVSLETREKLSKLNKGKKVPKHIVERIRLSLIGRKHSTETKLKISKSNLGKHRRKKSDKEKRKISDMNKGSGNPFFGRTHSDVTKKKISDANKRRDYVPWNKGKKLPESTKEKYRKPKSISPSETRIRNILDLLIRNNMELTEENYKNSKPKGYPH